MHIQNFGGFNFMVVISAIVVAVSIVLITHWYGITANSITIVVAIAMIAIIVITTAVTERAIRDTAEKSLGSLESIKTEVVNMNANQKSFFTRIEQELDQKSNVKPSISLRRESRPYALFLQHYYLLVSNSNGKMVMITIKPKPMDSSGIYTLNQESQKDFYINDWNIVKEDTLRTVTVTCEGLNGKEYRKEIPFNNLSETPIQVPLEEFQTQQH